jgi:DNA replicative helicase MCM subunit Mcm2 (Cdc46/Mcm family)
LSSSEAPPPSDRPQELRLTDAIRQAGVKRFTRQGALLVIQHSLEKNGRPEWTTILFKVKPAGYYATLLDFEESCFRSKIPRQVTQQIMAALSLDDDYYENALRYFEADNNQSILGTAIKFPNFFEDENDSSQSQQQRQQEQGQESSHLGGDEQDEDSDAPVALPSPPPPPEEPESDPDYPADNGGLELLTVSQTLQLDKPQDVRVIGLVDLIRTRFDLVKQIVLTCTNRDENCPNLGRSEIRTLKVGIFSVFDLPFVFPDGREALDLFCRCSQCHQPRRVVAGTGRYQSARIIELRNVEIDWNSNSVTTTNPNSTEQLDRLMVLVCGRHAKDIDFSEEAEMIGGLQIMPSSIIEARRGTTGRYPGNQFLAQPGGKYQKIFYAKHIKYTKREREAVLTEQDIQAIKRFASMPNLIRRLVSMFAPNVSGYENAKLALLLQAVGPAPAQRKNWYRRTWINSGLFGDPGTAKTILGEEAVKLLPGSQTVSGPHSTGKGVVAIAEKETDGSAYVRAGAAVLAHNASCFIDEIGSMGTWDDQDQFLDLMNKGYCDFNKLGIRKRIHAKTNFIVGANPTTFNWQNPDKIDKSELPVKLTLIDRLDHISIFRDTRGEEETKEWSAEMFVLSQKHINTDYVFLKKYIHYIRTESRFKEIEFADIELAHKLSDAWTEIKLKYPSLMSKRGYESIFRTATAVARFMCKNVIDNEVKEQTIGFIREMYRAFGADVISKSLDPQDMVFAELCQIIKSFADGLEYVMTEDESSFDITLNEAAQRACDKIAEVRDYFGVRLKDKGKLKVNSNRRLRDIHKKFVEKAGVNGMEYYGGRIKVVSNLAPRGLTLRWVANKDVERGEADSNNDDTADAVHNQ